MSRSQREEKGGKRVKKEQRPSRRGVRRMFLTCCILAIILLAGLSQYIYAQVALIDIPFGGLLKNSLMLFLGYLPRSALGVLWQLVYWGVIALFWPLTGFVMILTSLWVPCLLSLMGIYPALEKSFNLEETIKAMRDAQLNEDQSR